MWNCSPYLTLPFNIKCKINGLERSMSHHLNKEKHDYNATGKLIQLKVIHCERILFIIFTYLNWIVIIYS